MSRLSPDGTAEPVSRDQILRREQGQGNINSPCSADHEQDWQPYPVILLLPYVMTLHIIALCCLSYCIQSPISFPEDSGLICPEVFLLSFVFSFFLYVCVCACVCVFILVAHNRAIWPCHSSHSMPLALILPGGDQ